MANAARPYLRDAVAVLRAAEHDREGARLLLGAFHPDEVRSIARGIAAIALEAIDRSGADIDEYLDEVLVAIDSNPE